MCQRRGLAKIKTDTIAATPPKKVAKRGAGNQMSFSSGGARSPGRCKIVNVIPTAIKPIIRMPK